MVLFSNNMKNNTNKLLGISLALVIFFGSTPLGFSESLRVQLEQGMDVDQIQCDNNSHVLVLRTNGKMACVTEKTAEKKGWEILSFEKIIPEYEFTQIMIVIYEPTEIKGLNRDGDVAEQLFTESDLEGVPKVRQMLETALSAPEIPYAEIRKSIVHTTEDPPSKYIVGKTGPFSYVTLMYLTENELPQYQSWGDDNNIESSNNPDDILINYFEYKGEIFRLRIVDGGTEPGELFW